MKENETQRIDSYSFFEFCQKVQEEIIKGWRFDFDSNQNFPVQMGTFLTCGLVFPKVQVLEEQEVLDEEVKEEQPKKVGRKSLASLGSSSKAKVVE